MRWMPVMSRLAVRAVLQEQAQRLARRRPLAAVVEELEALDVAFVLQDARDLDLQPRRRHIDARVLGGHRVADPREHVCDRISHICLSTSGQLAARQLAIPAMTRYRAYQLLFVTPVMSPSSASLRKHRRHSANFRM